MKRAEQKVYRLTAPQWRVLSEIAQRHPDGTRVIRAAGTVDALRLRGLVDLVGPSGEALAHITELGQRVYARLSVGPMCSTCRRPVAFEARIHLPGGTTECLGCGRRRAA